MSGEESGIGRGSAPTDDGGIGDQQNKEPEEAYVRNRSQRGDFTGVRAAGRRGWCRARVSKSAGWEGKSERAIKRGREG